MTGQAVDRCLRICSTVTSKPSPHTSSVPPCWGRNRQANGHHIHIAALLLGRGCYRPAIAASAKFLAHLDPVTEGVRTIRLCLHVQPEVLDWLGALVGRPQVVARSAHPPAAVAAHGPRQPGDEPPITTRPATRRSELHSSLRCARGSRRTPRRSSAPGGPQALPDHSRA